MQQGIMKEQLGYFIYRSGLEYGLSKQVGATPF